MTQGKVLRKHQRYKAINKIIIIVILLIKVWVKELILK